ncbi:MAG: DUF5615 family PIN-like protein [Chloroflexi bacterium]|nr:DUF5615 family PIN-like protein [Chloroflexota bacterium]
MKFKIDENLPVELAELLRAAGYDALTVHEEALRGAHGDSLVEVCRREERILVTLDLDFASIAAYPPEAHPGFIVLRPHRQDKPRLISLLQRVVPLLAAESAEHRLWIVEDARVRIHPAETE